MSGESAQVLTRKNFKTVFQPDFRTSLVERRKWDLYRALVVLLRAVHTKSTQALVSGETQVGISVIGRTAKRSLTLSGPEIELEFHE